MGEVDTEAEDVAADVAGEMTAWKAMMPHGAVATLRNSSSFSLDFRPLIHLVPRAML